jgi:hypothetical protein
MSKNNTISRRDALARGSAFALASLLAGGMGQSHAESWNRRWRASPRMTAGERDAGDDCGHRLGEQGRNLLTSLGYVAGANVKYVCDTYVPAHKKALELAPKAQA